MNGAGLCDKEGTMSMFREDHCGNAQVVGEGIPTKDENNSRILGI